MSHPAVLLLHGQPGGAADWDGVVDRLRAAAGLRTIAIDRPGWDGATRARDLRGNAAAALAALDAHAADRAVLVGHSLGAAVAAWLAAVHPERVTALVLVAPAANLASLYPVDRWLAAPAAAEVAAAVAMGGVALGLSLPGVRRRIASRTGLDGAYLRSIARASLRPAAWRAYASEQRALVRDLPDLERRLADITAPTTILVGAGDRIVPPRAARVLAGQIAGARLSVADRAGHLLPQRAPDLVAGAVLEALAAPTASLD